MWSAAWSERGTLKNHDRRPKTVSRLISRQPLWRRHGAARRHVRAMSSNCVSVAPRWLVNGALIWRHRLERRAQFPELNVTAVPDVVFSSIRTSGIRDAISRSPRSGRSELTLWTEICALINACDFSARDATATLAKKTRSRDLSIFHFFLHGVLFPVSVFTCV